MSDDETKGMGDVGAFAESVRKRQEMKEKLKAQKKLEA